MAVQTELVVRRLTEQDQPLLESMYSTFVPLEAAEGLPPRDAVRRSAWLARLREGINLLALVDDKVAGHAVLLPIGTGAELTCFVHEDFRRQGVAAGLMKAAVQEARAAGHRSLTVFIDTHNIAARHGLLKFGFHPVWEDLEEGEYVYPLT